MTSINFDKKIVGVLIATCCYFSSCFVPQTAFNHSNDFKNIKSSVELSNNKKYVGYLSFSDNKPNAVMHSVDFSKTVTLDTKDILAIENDLGYFERKTLRSQHREIHYKDSKSAFVKRVTGEDAHLHLYQHEETFTNPKCSLPLKTVKYYVAIPGNNSNEVWDIDAELFGKEFNRKMQELFARDQKLVALIQQKDDKYSVRKFSLRANNKVRVIMNLNKDYNPQTASSLPAN